MTNKAKQPQTTAAGAVELHDSSLDLVSGGAETVQRSRVTAFAVTFSTQVTFNKGDPDQPVIVGSIPNVGR